MTDIFIYIYIYIYIYRYINNLILYYMDLNRLNICKSWIYNKI